MVRATAIWGANTGVGKTLISAGLTRSAVRRALPSLYLKPVQTGVPGDVADGTAVAAAAGIDHAPGDHASTLIQPTTSSTASPSKATTLFAWKQPVSPHVAAATEGRAVADDALVAATRDALAAFDGELALVERAGGVASPSPSGTLQCSTYRPLNLPALLVGDARLGGISATICASESLTSRGHEIDAVVLLRPPSAAVSEPHEPTAVAPSLLGNADALSEYYGSEGPPVFELPGPLDHQNVSEWLDECGPQVDALLDHLLDTHAEREARAAREQVSAASVLEDDMRLLWHPYTSTTKPTPCLPVESAQGVKLRLSDGSELIDGMSSWWAAVHGYRVPELDQAATRQIGKMSHVMFGGLTHRTAVGLGERLVECAPEPLQKVFLCDSGSVSVEVAIKMSLQYWRARGYDHRSKLLTVRGGYHGDTFGAMAVCDPVNGMHAAMFGGVLPSHIFAPRPKPLYGEPCTDDDILEFSSLLEANSGQIAAVILEPIVQGAGGMRFYSSEYLQRVRQLCDEHNTLLILDEIATGFGRTGTLFACEHAGIAPDIMCVGKALTGGYMTLGATLATTEVADGASGGRGSESPVPLMHGPTFMANPLACAVASASVDLLHSSPWQQRVSSLSEQLKAELMPLADSPAVADVRTLGAIGVVEMEEGLDVPRTQSILAQHGVWLRPFGKLLYTMPPFVMSEGDMGRVTGGMRAVVESVEREEANKQYRVG